VIPHQATKRLWQVAALMTGEAATLIAMSGLHLTGALHGGAKPFDRTHAGIAEATIAVVLIAGATTLLRIGPSARRVGLVATGFATVGFVVGLNFTIRGHDAAGIAYHAIVLPLLIYTFVTLLRTRTDDARAAAPGRARQSEQSRS
jgi:hypothetical protein